MRSINIGREMEQVPETQQKSIKIPVVNDRSDQSDKT